MIKDTKSFIGKAIKIHGKKYDYSQVVYRNSAEKVCIICRKHGEFWQRANAHLNGHGCFKCAPIARGKSLRETLESFIAKATLIHGKKYDYSQVVYHTRVKKIQIICKEHGEFWQQPQSHLNGHGCPICARESKSKIANSYENKEKLLRDFLYISNKVHGDSYDYSKVQYVNNKTKVCIICPLHGEFRQNPNSHTRGVGCKQCAVDRRIKIRRNSIADFVAAANDVHKNAYTYTKAKYKGNKTKICIICPKHGEFWQRPNDHISGKAGCPVCNKNASKLETRVAEWLKTLKIKVKTQQRILGKTIDIFLPEFKLGIEINGIYWHSEKFKNKMYHEEKSALAESYGIRLLHLWEHQINNKAAIVKSMLRIKLGLAKLRIFARECTVKEIPIIQAKDFLNKNHLQGYVPATIAYGLFLDDALVSVMTLGKPRFNKQYEWEILRLATKLNTIVVGGASKLFATFRKDYSPKSVITYADLDYADGGVYRNLGFKFIKFSKPSYFWVRQHTAISRYRTQKHKLQKLLGKEFDPSISETANMQRAGFFRVFNSGNAVFVRDT